MTDIRKAVKNKLIKAKRLSDCIVGTDKKQIGKLIKKAEKLLEQYDKTRKPMHSNQQEEMIQSVNRILEILSSNHNITERIRS